MSPVLDAGLGVIVPLSWRIGIASFIYHAINRMIFGLRRGFRRNLARMPGKRMAKSKARLRRLVILQEARTDLPPRTLFHAGPPYRGAMPKAVTNAAVQAALTAGWAENAEATRWPRPLRRSAPAF
jgi:hypothetical protein